MTFCHERNFNSLFYFPPFYIHHFPIFISAHTYFHSFIAAPTCFYLAVSAHIKPLFLPRCIISLTCSTIVNRYIEGYFYFSRRLYEKN